MDATKTKPFNIEKKLVYDAYKAVKANAGAAGVDRQTLEQFDKDLMRNLYKIWNRMSSGSYFPPPIVIEGRRFEIPNRYRHLSRIELRYAEWDLSTVHLVDERTGAVLARLYPQDKTQNASGLRRSLGPLAGASAPPLSDVKPATGLPPLLARMLDKQAADGLAPPYLPMNETDTDDGEIS